MVGSLTSARRRTAQTKTLACGYLERQMVRRWNNEQLVDGLVKDLGFTCRVR
jgi:hypothetical protein